MGKGALGNRSQIRAHRFVGAVIRVGEEVLELALVQGIQIHLPVLQVVLLHESCWLEAALDWLADGVVGADGLVGGVPEAERLLRNCDAEAAFEVTDRLTACPVYRWLLFCDRFR